MIGMIVVGSLRQVCGGEEEGLGGGSSHGQVDYGGCEALDFVHALGDGYSR